MPVGPDRHHDRPAPRGRPRGRRAPRRRAAAPRPADHQPGRPDRRGPRGHPAAVREPGAGLARLQGPVVPAAARSSRTCSRTASACSASAATGCATWSRSARAASSAAQFNPWALYKHVSGVNAVRLRRAADARSRARTTRPTRSGPTASSARRRSAARWRCPTIDLDTRHRRLRQGQGAAAERDPRRAGHARTS